MTTHRPPLSVRLDADLAAALDDYCATSGETRSHAVQESLTQYLVTRTGPTLSSLAEAVLPPLSTVKAEHKAKDPRQKRFRDYVREKRHR